MPETDTVDSNVAGVKLDVSQPACQILTLLTTHILLNPSSSHSHLAHTACTQLCSSNSHHPSQLSIFAPLPLLLLHLLPNPSNPKPSNL